MFLVNLGSKWPLANVNGVEGAVFLAEGNDRLKMSRPVQEFERLLFDPQLYLARLDAAHCGKACARLATHSWFGVEGLPDQNGASAREWMNAIREQIEELWPRSAPDPEQAQQRAVEAVDF